MHPQSITIFLGNLKICLFFVAHFLTTDSLVKSSVHIEGNGGCRKALSAEFSPSSRQVSWGGGSLTVPKHRNIMTYSNVFILVYSSKLHVYSIWGWYVIWDFFSNIDKSIDFEAPTKLYPYRGHHLRWVSSGLQDGAAKCQCLECLFLVGQFISTI